LGPKRSSDNLRAKLYQTEHLRLVPKPLAGTHVGHRENSITVDQGNCFDGLQSVFTKIDYIIFRLFVLGSLLIAVVKIVAKELPLAVFAGPSFSNNRYTTNQLLA
jgi:hypothetical protein